MDTFAALALASIPPSESVMKEKPRKSTDFIITKSMRNYILGMGMAFLILLMGMLFWFNNEENGMTPQRLTIFFTFFVMLQFWNLFNARVFGTSDSALKGSPDLTAWSWWYLLFWEASSLLCSLVERCSVRNHLISQPG